LLGIKLLDQRKVAVFAVLLVLSITGSTVIFSSFYGFYNTVTSALGGNEEGVLVMQTGASSIYTSRIPISIADGLGTIDGIDVVPVNLITSAVNDELIVFRGVSNITGLSSILVEGEIPSDEGLFLLLGQELARRLGDYEVGDIMLVPSPLSSDILPLKIAGIVKFGDLRDSEGIVPMNVAESIRGRQEGFASFISVRGRNADEIQELLQRKFTIQIEEIRTADGTLSILDRSSNIFSVIDLKGKESITLSLPLGKYILSYSKSDLTLILNEFVVTQDTTLKLDEKGRLGPYTLKVLADRVSDTFLLDSETGGEIRGNWMDGFWNFKVQFGIHTIMVNASQFQVAVRQDTVFLPSILPTLDSRNGTQPLPPGNGTSPEDPVPPIPATLRKL